uniref:Uncharacterized protein n=1 Tax=Setaria digitata TaxID=48799 RepID=A0A915PQR3_9BILA
MRSQQSSLDNCNSSLRSNTAEKKAIRRLRNGQAFSSNIRFVLSFGDTDKMWQVVPVVVDSLPSRPSKIFPADLFRGEASVWYYRITRILKPNFAVAIASPLLQPAQVKPVAGRAVYSHMVASSSATPSPALCPRPQNAVTPVKQLLFFINAQNRHTADHYPMAPLGPSGGPLSGHGGTPSGGMPLRGQFLNHAVQMSLPPHMPDGVSKKSEPKQRYHVNNSSVDEVKVGLSLFGESKGQGEQLAYSTCRYGQLFSWQRTFHLAWTIRNNIGLQCVSVIMWFGSVAVVLFPRCTFKPVSISACLHAHPASSLCVYLRQARSEERQMGTR